MCRAFLPQLLCPPCLLSSTGPEELVNAVDHTIAGGTRRAMLDLRRFPTRPTWPAVKALALFSPGQVHSEEVDKDQAIQLLGTAQKVHARPRV